MAACWLGYLPCLIRLHADVPHAGYRADQRAVVRSWHSLRQPGRSAIAAALGLTADFLLLQVAEPKVLGNGEVVWMVHRELLQRYGMPAEWQPSDGPYVPPQQPAPQEQHPVLHHEQQQQQMLQQQDHHQQQQQPDMQQQEPPDVGSESDDEPPRPAREAAAMLLRALPCVQHASASSAALPGTYQSGGRAGRSVRGPQAPPDIMTHTIGVTQSRAERKQRRNFAAEAGETGDFLGDGEDMEEGTPPPRQQPRAPQLPQSLEVCGTRMPCMP